MRYRRPARFATGCLRRAIVSLLVIALTTVITTTELSTAQTNANEQQASAQTDAIHASAPKSEPEQPTAREAAAKGQPGDSKQVGASLEPKGQILVQEIGPQKEQVAAAAVLDATAEKPELSAEASEASRRKGRADQSEKAGEQGKAEAKSEDKATNASPEKSSADKQSSSKAETAKAAPKPAKSVLTGKSAPKSKLPANLGTVTSTGSGGPAHYMSKHDAYSAIAEKHGALAQDAMRKSDKRQLQGFGGIQKASGLGDMLSPFKGVTDSGLARTLGASMRSIMKGKYSVPAYVASALLGAVALMAFYESPISPLPVPPLPEPPVGRFPPEMPNISPNVQVPFRSNQQFGQQNYNQRSLNAIPQAAGYLNQQNPQVLFPSSSGTNNMVVQQRQMATSNPVQLAANLLSGGQKQNAQRKSGLDYEQSPARSLFGTATSASAKIGAPANQQKQQNSILSFLGLGGGGGGGGSGAVGGSVSDAPAQSASVSASTNPAGQSNTAQLATSSASLEAKGQSGGLSNSHLVNKVKSYFSRYPQGGTSSGAGLTNNHSPYEQYQRMSLVQALMKDTAFLPAFLTPTRKSSPAGQSSGGHSKIQSITNALSAAGTNAAARMQVDGPQTSSQQVPAASKQKSSNTGYGLARTADRIAHALLETFTSGAAQRSAGSQASAGYHSADSVARKASSSEESPIESASSLLSDIMSSYNGPSSADQHSQQQSYDQAKQQVSQQPQASQQQQSQSQSQQQPTNQQQLNGEPQPSARSGDTSSFATDEKQQVSVNAKQQSSISNSPAQSSASSSEAHSRKTRSIGLEYPIESNQELIQREQQPSKAAQINHVIDFVADSYAHNRLLFNFVMNQVGLSQAVPYVEQILASGSSNQNH